VVFFPEFFGVSIAGVASELDAYDGLVTSPPMAAQPQDRGSAGFGAPVPRPILTVTNNQVEVEVQGIAGQALTWAWDLRLSKVAAT
jgi:hypothetical protein